MEDIYEKYQVKQVINASGKMTILGGSRVSEDICQQMNIGASHFFEVKDLLDKTGNYLAALIGVESAYIVNSASGAIAQSVAACVSRGKLQYILDIYNPENKKREVIICKGHNVDYGTPIEVTIGMGGGHVVEAGYANKCTLEHIEAKINENTVALIYVKSHHCVQKGMPDMKAFIELGHRYHLPVIVDAAAEEDLKEPLKESLKKRLPWLLVLLALGMVVSSVVGLFEQVVSQLTLIMCLLIGKKVFIDQVKKQSQGIGRVMKVGKENILGLTYAIEKYLSKEHLTLQQQSQRLEIFNQKLNANDGISARIIQDGAGRLIMRSEITFDEKKLSKNALQIAQALKEGELHIYTRDYRANEGKIEIDIRDVNDQELNMIYEKIVKIIGGRKDE